MEHHNRITRGHKIALAVIGSVILFVLFIVAVSPDDPKIITAKKSDRQYHQETNNLSSSQPERLLAIIDADGPVKPDDIRVKVIKEYLDSLSLYYNESVDTIAEYTSRIHGVLKEKGLHYTSRQILRDMLISAQSAYKCHITYREMIILTFAMVNQDEM